MLIDWIRRSVREIDEDPALRFYAALLCWVMALNGASWFAYKAVVGTISTPAGVCWPTFPQCLALRSHLTPDNVRNAVGAHVGLSAVAGVLFLQRRRAAIFVLLVAILIGTAITALDFRLHSNETYMLSWCLAVLLFAPRKAVALQAIVALFYFWAGTLKVNADWMSGAALYRLPFLVPEALIPAACVYVLFLEMAIIWGLFAPSPRIRWIVYAQLLLFHAVSWNVVGYHYPLMMLGITAIYPLVWRVTPGETLTWSKVRTDRPARLAIGGVAVLFSCFQVVPRLSKGDPAITGEGRYFALHMFDARVVCAGGATVRRNGHAEHVDLIDPGETERLHCDPILLLAAAKRLCRGAPSSPDTMPRVDVLVDARRATQREMRPLIHIDDLCNKPIEFSPWHHNDWIGSGF